MLEIIDRLDLSLCLLDPILSNEVLTGTWCPKKDGDALKRYIKVVEAFKNYLKDGLKSLWKLTTISRTDSKVQTETLFNVRRYFFLTSCFVGCSTAGEFRVTSMTSQAIITIIFQHQSQRTIRSELRDPVGAERPMFLTNWSEVEVVDCFHYKCLALPSRRIQSIEELCCWRTNIRFKVHVKLINHCMTSAADSFDRVEVDADTSSPMKAHEDPWKSLADMLVFLMVSATPLNQPGRRSWTPKFGGAHYTEQYLPNNDT